MSHTAGELAEYLGAGIEGDSSAIVAGIAAAETAGAEDLIYSDSPKHMEAARKSAARCVLTHPGTRIAGKTILEAENPKFAFVKAAAWLAPKRAPKAGVHATAIIAASARVDPRAFVGPYAVVEEEVEIGPGAEIGAFCFLGSGSKVGADCHLHPRVTLYAGARLGKRVLVHSGAVIGSDGFGYVFGEGRHWKFPQVGAIEIEDDVEIGANTTVDRGSLGITRIEPGVKIDNLVQIAHNVRVGEHTAIAAQTGVSGSSTIGKGVLIGGQVGIADNCTLEDGAIAGAQAGIPSGKTIRSGQIVWGTPARPLDRFKEQYVFFSRLPELAARVRRLEQAQERE
ncbi:MAG TPA: UDP-3-O-(3-hydroxymyristoyl)glucosamine N-acyltransferase [Candidatus Sulfotelmatobacter sp.]|nr:UDP-3-O-(3-hydroxymyristoyl)glucosamine N-acyltransferase [Candidatus Sulfotelmatobacter sp.]